MTNDNTTREKANAVFFAAIMVVSMVAVGFAAAPAAALENSPGVSFSDTNADDYQVSVDVTDGGEDGVLVVTYEDSDGDNVIAGLNTAADTGDGTSTVTVDIEDTGGLPGDHTAHLIASGDLSGSYEAGDTVSDDTLDAVAADTTSSLSYSADDDTTVDFEVDGETQGIYYQGQDITATGLEADTDYVLRSVDEFADDGGITSSSFESEYTSSGGGTIDIDSANLESGDYFLRGGNLDENRDNSFELTVQEFSAEWEEDSYDNGETEAELTTESQRNSYNVIISGDGLDYDDLEALFAGDNSPVGDAEIDDNEEDDEIIVEGFRDDQIIANFSNAELDSGDYQFDLEVQDTEATDTASVTVQEEDVEANFNESITTAAAGDVVEVSLELEDTSETYIGLGGSNVGFFDVVRVEDDDDDDEVTFQVNTRVLGTNQAGDAYSSSNDIVERNPDDATYQDEDGDTLDTNTLENFRDSGDGLDLSGDLIRPAQAGEYDMVASSDGTFAVDEDNELTVENELDIATLDLVEPTINGVTVHTATAGDTDEADNVEALLEDVTPSETVAFEDRMVLQVQADGVEGFVAQNSDADLDSLNEGVEGSAFQTLLDNPDEGVNFEVEATSATANQEAASLDFSETTVYFADGQFFVVVDTSDQDAAFDGSVSDGDDFDVTYEYVTNDDDRYKFENAGGEFDDGAVNDAFPYFDADSDASAEASFTLEDRDASFDNTNAEGDVEVVNSEEATVTGTTNVAPGTDVSVRIRSASGVSPGFILTADDVTVSEDGTFEATIDTTEGEVGNEATINFRVGSSNIVSEDAVLVDQTQDPANFAVSELSPQDVTATVGDTLTVSATVENTGGQEATQTVEFRVGGDAVASQDVTLGAGNSTTVEFADIDTSGLDAGDYEHGVFTDDDEQTATLTLEAADTGDDGGDDTGGDDTGGDDTGGDDTGGDDTGGDDTGGDDGTDDGGSTDGSTPGFGAVVALVALIAAALLATRRND
ncbi:BGTF surface domain-containing protein [Halorubrum ezzemoulense]|uniref:Uncharacterized protein n=1 Tax=Halorubrum ezzemoulense TaxID=337243 RepID=A0A256JF90_HALEZ|nr:BGTF surface domain-containing protein [Halorubrum ezzemoulense]OYR67196.1 hypothetical protein DJ78_16075 [Halorubrum ezzemoulense]